PAVLRLVSRRLLRALPGRPLSNMLHESACEQRAVATAMKKPAWVDKYRTGSGSDRVRRTIKIAVSQVEPGRYHSRFRIRRPTMQEFWHRWIWPMAALRVAKNR
ncbi:MAG TPA: hypothetical protein VE977_09165, partial [Pyrinomonadaceae bacterium]|nr:hypothetical protein [Pyrinomonadaceae bacterium]